MPDSNLQPSTRPLDMFRASLVAAEPPGNLSPALRALWHLEKGDWEAAHAIAQDDRTRDGAWIHALVHRIEGDEWNARYWYGQARRPVGQGDVDAERAAILAELLNSPQT